MALYQTPKKYYFRIHHIRPRFKRDLESVLFFFANGVSSIAPKIEGEFAEEVNNVIRMFPGNAVSTAKTINNWRTEISSLFGFIQPNGDCLEPGLRARELAENRDIIAFFKTFLFTFQYPGGHLKSHEIAKQIEAGVHFKPAQYILRLMTYVCDKEKSNIGFTKPEICHCVFNDLRCTRDNEDVALTWLRIKANRRLNVTYISDGDVIRYAGDIMDYMVDANLLKTYDGVTYYLQKLEKAVILKFVESKEWFTGYDGFYGRNPVDCGVLNNLRQQWFEYVNRDLSDTDFSTNIMQFISASENDNRTFADALKNEKSLARLVAEKLDSGKELTTKEIGDMGEMLVIGHECSRLKNGGREDLIHLVQKIPENFAVGYDISSRELNEEFRFIEVKTTISNNPLIFNGVVISANEWNAAKTMRGKYYIYRLMLTRHKYSLFLLRDPVGQYKNDKLSITPHGDNTHLSFSPERVGNFEELLLWHTK